MKITGVSMLNEHELVSIFCEIDDFLIEFKIIRTKIYCLAVHSQNVDQPVLCQIVR